MTEHTEKDILMKCTKLGYEEEAPRQLIDKLVPNEPEENYIMHCPECDHKMIVKNSSTTKDKYKILAITIVVFVIPDNSYLVIFQCYFTYHISLFRSQNLNIKKTAYAVYILQMVERIGIEPMTPCVQGRCSPS